MAKTKELTIEEVMTQFIGWDFSSQTELFKKIKEYMENKASQLSTELNEYQKLNK